MPAAHVSTACEWHARSTPFPCLFRLESELWNPKAPPSSLAGGPCEGLRRNPQYPQTSSPDRFALAAPDFRCEFFLPLGHDRRCLSRLDTSESPGPARPAADRTARETTGTGHPRDGF